MVNKPDEAHRLTDKELEALERRISAEYGKAAKELQGKIDDYFAKFAKRDAELKKKLDAGEITEDYYKQWRLAQIGRGERFEALRDRVAERMTKANETAAAYINDATPGLYSLNRNYAAYTIEQVAGDVGFDLWDEQTVKRLIKEQPDLMPYYPPERAVKRGIDLKWGKQQITAQVTSGILQGDSIKNLSDRLQTNIPTMNRNSAIRAARTAVTGAQNAGRMDSYEAAKGMGIKLKKQWLATLDGRTRHEHAMLDGQTVDTDAPFETGGYKLMFPGDPAGAPEMTYNCRCSMIAAVEGVGTSDAKRRAKEPKTGESVIIDDMTYSEWEAWKKSENKSAWDVFQKKGKNYSEDQKQYQEYKAVLGKKIPDRFSDFQDLKYNNPVRWETLKTEKRMANFVNNAPCVTTPKKYTGYFLKPGAKNTEDFFSVGYAQNDQLRLRYDMARQFDIDKAVDVELLNDGAKKFNIYMELGVTKKKTFCTGWIQDTQDSLPRVVTGFRKDRGR